MDCNQNTKVVKNIVFDACIPIKHDRFEYLPRSQYKKNEASVKNWFHEAGATFTFFT